MKLLLTKRLNAHDLVRVMLLDRFMFLMKYIFFLERAKRLSVVQDTVDQDVDAASIDEPNAKFIKIEKLLNANLSEIEMDSIIHGENTTTGISGADC